jgi:protein-tyrosine-phosphatase
MPRFSLRFWKRRPVPNELAPPAAVATNGTVTPGCGIFPIRILFVCGSDTCRSPMAKIILQQKLKSLGRSAEYTIESAGYSVTVTAKKASDGSREAMVGLFGQDLLETHQPRALDPEAVEQADLILVMSPAMKDGLPADKTFTLKEYTGDHGAIAEPYGLSNQPYISTAHEISYYLDLAMLKILALPPRIISR